MKSTVFFTTAYAPMFGQTFKDTLATLIAMYYFQAR